MDSGEVSTVPHLHKSPRTPLQRSFAELALRTPKQTGDKLAKQACRRPGGPDAAGEAPRSYSLLVAFVSFVTFI